MEKRKSPRRKVNVEAVINFSASQSLFCTIRDYSSSGCLVELSSYRQSKSKVPINFEAVGPGQITLKRDGRYITADVEVVHASDVMLGIRFLQKNLKFLDAIERSDQKENPLSDSNQSTNEFIRSRLDQRNRSNLIQAANTCCQQFLDERMSELFTKINASLLEAADNQKTDADQHPYFAALSGFEKQAKRIELKFREGILSDALALSKGQKQTFREESVSNAKQDKIELVHKDDFEDWLVVRVTASKVELKYRDLLSELQMRFDVAFSGAENTHVVNPYSPFNLCQSFAESIDFLKLPVKIERIIFSIFQETVLELLQDFYQSLNELFINAGVLKDFNVSKHLYAQAINKNKNTAGPVRIAEAKSSESAKTLNHTSVSTAASRGASTSVNAYSTIRNLWSLNQNSSNVSLEPTAIPESLTHALEKIKTTYATESTALVEDAPLRSHLTRTTNELGLAISESQLASVDFVDGLMGKILQRANIENSLKSQLKKLEVPIFEAMMNDQNFFNDSDHPLQTIINRIIQLAEKPALSDTDLNKKLVSNINELISADFSDSNVLEEKIALLETQLEHVEDSFVRNKARVIQAYEGKQRVHLANTDIEFEISQRLSGREVPGSLLQLIDHGWRELMRLCYLREGKESRAWEIALIVIDQLLVRSEPQQVDPANVLFKQEELIRLVQKGLKKVPASLVKQEEIIIELSKWVERGDFSDVSWEKYQSPIIKNPWKEALPEEASKKLGRWLKRAEEVAVDQWVEFTLSSGEKRTCQLAWKSQDKELSVFVDAQGRKSNELTKPKLAKALKKGVCNILHDVELSPVQFGMHGMMESMHEGLFEKSNKDKLTQVYNRESFERLVAKSLNQAKRQSIKYLLSHIDIVGFGALNSALGFSGGDKVLKLFVKRLQDAVGEDVEIGRLGGNSFAVLSTTMDADASYRLIARVKDQLENERYIIENESYQISTMISVITYDANFKRVSELLQLVDSAVKIAKKSGKKGVQVVDINDPAIKNYEKALASLNIINKAIDGDNLSLRCQKIAPFSTTDSSALIYEVLISIVDESGTYVSAEDAIDAAEEHGMIGQLDRRVIQYLLAWMVEEKEFVKTIDGLSVNLSSQSVNDETFLDFLFNQFVATGVQREKVIFEITEIAAVASFEDAADFITELKNIGCRFSIDNFGMAQSAFNSLRLLPVDFVKIEGTLIESSLENQVDLGLVRSIVELSHFLDKKVVAKNVSSAKLKRSLQEIGLDYVQGFFVGKPMLLDQLPDKALNQSM